MTKKRVPLDRIPNLSGPEGNAYVLLSLCRTAARRQGWNDARITEILDEAMSGDYEHLVATLNRYFVVLP